MFTELSPLLADRPLLLTLSAALGAGAFVVAGRRAHAGDSAQETIPEPPPVPDSMPTERMEDLLQVDPLELVQPRACPGGGERPAHGCTPRARPRLPTSSETIVTR